MLNLVDALAVSSLAAIMQDASIVGYPAPPTVAAFLAEGPGALGYDTFDEEGRAVVRVTLTPVPGSNHGRPDSERVWEARRVRFSPQADRLVEDTTSLECPGLSHVLERMASLEVGRFDVAGVTELPSELGPQTRDGYTYRLHGPGNDPINARTRLSTEGSAGHVGDLGRAADFQFKDCWRPVPNG